MFQKDGIVTREMFEQKLPSKERRAKGAYVVMECFQGIPCNPCTTSCKFGAVKSMPDINQMPVTDLDQCTGCGKCVSICPGLACFVIDETYSEEEFSLKIPYEMCPLPKVGDVADGLDREGKIVTTVKVLKVLSGSVMDKTNVITIAVPKEFLYEVRNIKVRG